MKRKPENIPGKVHGRGKVISRKKARYSLVKTMYKEKENDITVEENIRRTGEKEQINITQGKFLQLKQNLKQDTSPRRPSEVRIPTSFQLGASVKG